MNITQEKTGDLTATLKVELTQDDYRDKVDNTLKELQKNANMKGFRPGKVPMGIIKKMYRTQVMAEEVNKLVSDAVNDYIKENDVDLLGSPIVNNEKMKLLDFENDKSFEFFFDYAVVPEIELNLADVEADYYEIEIDDETFDRHLNNYLKRAGKPVEVDTVEEEDIVKGKMVQLDKDGNIIEGGIFKEDASFIPKYIKDEKVKTEVTGKKKGDVIVFNPLKATGNVQETASMLGIEKQEAEKLDSDFQFTITSISRLEPAELNEELFKMVFPNGEVKTEEQFKEKYREELEKYYQVEAENYFVHTVMEKLNKQINVDFPEDFLKRWLLESDSQMTEERINSDFEGYLESLKQQIIINKLAKEYNINIDSSEIRSHIKDSFASYYGFNTDNEETMNQLNAFADSVMQNKEEVNKVYDELFDKRIREMFKENLKLNTKKITYKDFSKLVEEHHKHHHHEH